MSSISPTKPSSSLPTTDPERQLTKEERLARAVCAAVSYGGVWGLSREQKAEQDRIKARAAEDRAKWTKVPYVSLTKAIQESLQSTAGPQGSTEGPQGSTEGPQGSTARPQD